MALTLQRREMAIGESERRWRRSVWLMWRNGGEENRRRHVGSISENEINRRKK
jgi:hypothetical protein